MTEQLKQIAARIVDIRLEAGLSVDEMAHTLGIDPEAYLSYEQARVEIPISAVCEISNKFGVEVTAILTGEEPKLRVYSLVRAGKGVSVERFKAYYYQELAYNFTHKRVSPFLVEVAPDQAQTPFSLNSHPGQEFLYVLEGTLMVSVNQTQLTLHEGDSLYLDSGYPHGMKAQGDKSAKFLAIVI